MKFYYRSVLSILIVTLILTLISPIAITAEDNFPERGLTFIITFGPGGGADTTLSPIRPVLEDFFGQSVAYDYRPGAGAQVGIETLKRSIDDGYTAGYMPLPHFINTILFQDPGYEVDDFEPLGILTTDVPMWFTHPDSPDENINDVIERAQEEEVIVAVGSLTSEIYLTVAIIEEATGVEFNVVPTGSGGEVVSGVMGKHYDVGVTRPSSLTPYRDEIKGLGILYNRSPNFPDTQTFAEQVPDIQMPRGLAIARGVMVTREVKENYPERFEKWVEAFKHAAHSDTFAETLNNLGLELDYHNPEEAKEFVYSQMEIMSEYREFME